MSENVSILDEALPGIYPDLRLIARHVLRPVPGGLGAEATTLVHDAYLKLRDRRMPWRGREHLLSTAAIIMRRILLDRARCGVRLKRGGDRRRVDLLEEHFMTDSDDQRLIELDEALEALEALDPLKARLVEMRYFVGLTIEESAQALGLSPRTVKKNWAVAKLWLLHRLEIRETV